MELDPIGLLAPLPEWARTTLAYASLVLALLTTLTAGLGRAIPLLYERASRTETLGDDRAVEILATFHGRLAFWLDVVRAFLPRLTIGSVRQVHERAEEARRGRATPPTSSSTSVVGVVLCVALASSSLT